MACATKDIYPSISLYATIFVRYFFFVFNLIFVITGIVGLGVGIYSWFENDSWRDLIDMDTLFHPGIAAGIIVACLGFLGCCAAIKRLQWMLVIYSSLVFLIFILEIAAGTYAYTKRGKFEQKFAEGVKEEITKNYGKGDKVSIGMTISIDLIQKELDCCGAAGPNDWLHSYWYTHNNTEHAHVPTSCCRTVAPNCNVGVNANSTGIYNQGCIAAGMEFTKSNKLVANIGVGIAVVELLVIVFAMYLCTAFRREKKESLLIKKTAQERLISSNA